MQAVKIDDFSSDSNAPPSSTFPNYHIRANMHRRKRELKKDDWKKKNILKGPTVILDPTTHPSCLQLKYRQPVTYFTSRRKSKREVR
jgi:hypothetical protein